MKVVERPDTVKDYYRYLKEDYISKLEESKKILDTSIKNNKSIKNKVDDIIKYISKNFKINLRSYIEYNENRYITGQLYDDIYKFYRNSKSEDEVKYSVILLKYVQNLKAIHDSNINIKNYNKILSLSYSDYCKIIKTYYYEVQRQMIVNGYAYEFQGDIGTICINRCKNLKKIPIIDTKATKANKEKLKAEGKELYDEKKAAWCKDHGIEYKGVEYRIFKRNDYLYEFVLIYSKLPNPFRHKFEPVDYWAANLRGKTKKDFIQQANGNLSYICNLDITFRTKITICNEIDELLYLNFIRNEHQTPITASKDYR